MYYILYICIIYITYMYYILYIYMYINIYIYIIFYIYFEQLKRGIASKNTNFPD